MKSLALISIIVATVAAPALAARAPDPRRALRRLLVFVFAFNAVYLAYVTLIHARFFVPSRF